METRIIGEVMGGILIAVVFYFIGNIRGMFWTLDEYGKILKEINNGN